MKSIWLELITETAKCKSLSEAAEKCHISQPAASRMIMNAENELSAKLFNRSTKMTGLELTERGKQLLPYIQDAADAYKRLERKVQETGPKVLRFGMSEDTWGAKARSRILSGFYLEYPDVTLKIDLFKNNELINALMRDEVDLIVFSWGYMLEEDPPRPFETLPVTTRILGDRPINVAYGKNHVPPGVSNGMISVADGKDLEYIIHTDIRLREKQKLQRYFFLETCRRFGFEPKILVVENASNIKQKLAVNGKGVFLSSAPEELREFPGIEFALLKDCPYVARYFFVYQTLKYSQDIEKMHKFLQPFFTGYNSTPQK